VRTFHFYDKATGIFTGDSLAISGRLDVLKKNTPDGCDAFEGAVDYLSQRVEAGALVDYQPPQPDSNHEWSPQVKRWVKRADVVELELRRAAATAEMEALEKLQIRSITELWEDPNSAPARENFDRRKARISELRRIITDETGTTSP
jgi:hypothetical protein